MHDICLTHTHTHYIDYNVVSKLVFFLACFWNNSFSILVCREKKWHRDGLLTLHLHGYSCGSSRTLVVVI